ncbi:hypothetical protein MMC13_000681 [Lambiella insularis]|nr:hypothetical protein [Lambiella insularis]
MDSRHLYSRSQLQTHLIHEEARYPIPPPPYSSQRPELPSHNDPFFPRRPRFENSVASPNTLDNTASFGLPPPPYPPNPFAAPQSHGATDSRLRRGSYESSSIYDQLWREDHQNRNGDMPQHDDVHCIPLIPPPPAPAPPSSFPPLSVKTQYAPQEGSRRLPNGVNPLTMYGNQSPPPPPQFGSRQMLPPTSPQHAPLQYNVQPQITRGPPSSFPFARDLPALSAAHRPGSSMSISSMLGANSDKSVHDAAPASRSMGYTSQPATSVPLPVNHIARAPSPPLVHTSGQYLKRARTPDSHTAWRGDQSRSRAYSGGLQQRPSSGFQNVSQESPLHDQNTPYQLSRFNGTTDTNSRSPELRRSSVGVMEYNGTKRHGEFLTTPNEHETDQERPPVSPKSTEKYTPVSKGTDEQTVPTLQGYTNVVRRRGSGGKGPQHGFHNHSMVQNQSQNPSTNSIRIDQANGSAMNYPFLSRSSNSASSPNQQSRVHQPAIHEHNPEPSFGARPRAGATRYETGQNAGFREAQLSAAETSPRLVRQTFHSNETPEEQQARDSPVSYPQFRRHQYVSTPDRLDHLVGTPEDIHQQPRSIHSLMVDNSRGRGRISPLPQAVQGAQGRMRGPASEPGIKNEFARMFSGIGSGVGSAMSTPVPPEPGASLSFPPSPIRVDEAERRTSLNGRNEVHDNVKPRIASKGGRKSRKVKDEEPKGDADNGDTSGLLRSFSARGPKRVRQSYNLQNLHNSHHHHHHAETAATTTTFPVLSNTKRTFTPGQITSITPTATPHHRPHHHHFAPAHHHHPHHHHHYALKPPRIPIVTVNSKFVLDSVRDLPRHHLGSILYTPVLTVPSWTASHEDVKFGYISTPRPLPRFEGKENCTITVRVPRLYLQQEEREEICFRRAIWGSEVYTDDSDPVAAAIHGGWIRGDWGEEVDSSALDVEAVDSVSKRSKEGQEAALVLSSPPATPMDPVKDHDMHITLLILPTLQSYASLVVHGVKSRSWETKHDGLSFMIDKIAWLKEKASRGEERGGEARRKRMRTMMDRQAKIAGPACPTSFVARDLKRMKTTAVAS